MSWLDNLPKMIDRRAELELLISNPDKAGTPEYIKWSQEYSELGPIVEAITSYQVKKQAFDEADEIINDPSAEPDIKELATEEYHELKALLPREEKALQIMLLPRDEADSKNAIMEIRPGTGGDEAGLFARDLLEMYQKYAAVLSWKFEIIELSENDLGGVKEAQARISGQNVFAKLKFEAGTHRVQRVPETETQGRVHTSAATVAVLPEAEEIDIKIEEKDIRIDTMRASGAGGQHVNTTDSAVRITHLPTGIVVTQAQKSQHRNRDEAMRILRARRYDLKRSQAAAERAADRKSQVGSGDRSERIRTYNYPQGRVSDHRINLTLYKLDKVMIGESLGELVDALVAADEAERLAAIGNGE